MYKPSEIHHLYIDIIRFLYPYEIYNSLRLDIEDNDVYKIDVYIQLLEDSVMSYKFHNEFISILCKILHICEWEVDPISYSYEYKRLLTCLFKTINLTNMTTKDLDKLCFIEINGGWVIPSYILPYLHHNLIVYDYINNQEIQIGDIVANNKIINVYHYTEYLYKERINGAN